jgi:hypothetical protein
LSSDPLGMVDGPNTYGFCGGDPVNRSDPMGTDWVFTGAGNWMEVAPFGTCDAPPDYMQANVGARWTSKDEQGLKLSFTRQLAAR